MQRNAEAQEAQALKHMCRSLKIQLADVQQAAIDADQVWPLTQVCIQDSVLLCSPSSSGMAIEHFLDIWLFWVLNSIYTSS